MRTTLLLCVLLLASCAPDARVEPPPPLDAAMLADATRAANALGGDLIAMLTGELKRGGPDAAIAICADSAQARTRQHQEAGLAVRRVGTRVRNPENAPDSFERVVLDAFEASLAAGQLPADTVVMQALAGGGTRLRYLRPVRVQEGCLACHGAPENIPPSVRAVLAARYPEDRATGYAVGDLRGAVSVVVDRKK